jgi:hypothetical protein
VIGEVSGILQGGEEMAGGRTTSMCFVALVLCGKKKAKSVRPRAKKRGERRRATGSEEKLHRVRIDRDRWRTLRSPARKLRGLASLIMEMERRGCGG